MKKYFLVYKITNVQNGKFYIGAHETFDKNDEYMGSGVYLKRAQNKYGKESFIKEIMYECNSREEMYQKEREFIEISINSYNIMEGGHGGWSYARSKISPESYAKVSKTMKTEAYKQKTIQNRLNSSIRMKEMGKDKNIRKKQAISLSEKMNDPLWKESIGKSRSEKISKTLKGKSPQLMTEERNQKVKEAMTGRVCVTINGKKRRLKSDDSLLMDPNIILGWK